MNKQVEFLVKLRDTSQMLADAANEYIESLTPLEIQTKEVSVQETTFSTLNFEPNQSIKMGIYEIAFKANNKEDKWHQAHTILSDNKANIKDRYHGESYQYSYWLYGEGKIYRQKLKPQN